MGEKKEEKTAKKKDKEKETEDKTEKEENKEPVAAPDSQEMEAEIQNQIQQLMNDFVQRMQAQGLSIDQYYQFTGLDQAKIQEQMRPQALKRIQSRLVLEKVAEVENIQISDEKFEEELKTMADMYKMEVEKLKELMGDAEKEQMKKDIAVQEAVTLVAESAKVVEKKEEAAE